MMQLLDHGYIKLIETWGSDERIVESARMSTDGAFHGWGTSDKPGDEKLLRYLYNHKHSSPFEMAGATFEIQAPIFVFREWHRHRTQSYNELSARYTTLPAMDYLPSIERLMRKADGTNRQANRIEGAPALTRERAEEYRISLCNMYTINQDFYEFALSIGVPKELARIHLPVARYSRMRASANLRNWLGFMTLRSADDAQEEIREYSNAIRTMLTPCFPRVMELVNK